MGWSNLDIVSKVEVYKTKHTRYMRIPIPYTRTWILKGYDTTGNLITRIDKKERINYLQYVEFIKQLKFCSYRLSEAQMKFIKNKLLINDYIKSITMNDFLEVCKRAYLTNESSLVVVLTDFIHSIKNKTFREKYHIAEQIGLTYDELISILLRLT